MTRFSVVIAVHDAEATLGQTLASLDAQTFRDFEVIAYDDASTDGSRAVLESWAAGRAGVSLLGGDDNRGAGVARTACLRVAAGDYACFLDADDLWLPERLAVVDAALAARPADIVCTDMTAIDASGHALYRMRPAARLTRWTHIWRNPFLTSASAVRLGFPGAREMPDLRLRQDYAYWMKLSRNTDLEYLYLPQALTLYRRRAGSLSSSPWRNALWNYRAFRAAGHGPVASVAALGPHTAARVWRGLAARAGR